MLTVPTSCSRRGFTLIELLASIAVIAILAALVYAGIGKVLNAARSAQLASNLRQVHTGLISYVQDHNNQFPLTSKNGYDPDVPGSPSLSWQQVVAPYVGEDVDGWSNSERIYASVFRDPTDLSLKQVGEARPTRNIAINGYSSGSWGLHDRNINTIELPAKMLALTSGLAAMYGDEYAGGMRIRNINYGDATQAEKYTRIAGEHYCVFVDGHLEVIPQARMIEEASLGAYSILFDPAATSGRGWHP
ncbi:type II secretion system protein [Coraliomargarita algicola]|uniref:Type II secretion system protein n=1 Tax=Coraliomargarita algicola TaxID=3092156 RepID=A0ABZ0RMR0_9BACT|nr:type II secretion system protein [Coraliomargarita sp. J2-16]WPJ96691.1 type II secretion system protein [Coraliomargarita sp. J2-16]